MIIKKVLELEKSKYYIKHLNIISNLLPVTLTEKEIMVISSFMSLEKNLIEDEMFNTLTRKKVREKLKMSPGGLGNHLKSLIEKAVIDKHPITGKLKIKAFMFPEEDVQGYQIKLVNVSKE